MVRVYSSGPVQTPEEAKIGVAVKNEAQNAPITSAKLPFDITPLVIVFNVVIEIFGALAGYFTELPGGDYRRAIYYEKIDKEKRKSNPKKPHYLWTKKRIKKVITVMPKSIPTTSVVIGEKSLKSCDALACICGTKSVGIVIIDNIVFIYNAPPPPPIQVLATPSFVLSRSRLAPPV